MRVVLASKSPRRREILSMLGVRFDIISADADESSDITDPALLVRELALRKGRATCELLKARGEWDDNTLIIASDTVVATEDQILGKPRDDADAKEMLRALSGKEHRVISGVALLWKKEECADFDATGVRFADMSEEDIAWYVQSKEPCDKAGAYAVQGLASMWIKGLDGDYFNVVGLPVYKLNALVKAHLGCMLPDLADR